MTETSPREEVLSEASRLITGDRNKSYGSPTENFDNTAAVWNVLLGHKLKEPITATEVGTLMIGLKLARTIAQPKRDNFVDMAGYAACAWECEDAGVVELPTTRYWRGVDFDSTSYYRQDDKGVLTFVSDDKGYRISSVYRDLDEVLNDPGWRSIEEIPVADVPGWAR